LREKVVTLPFLDKIFDRFKPKRQNTPVKHAQQDWIVFDRDGSKPGVISVDINSRFLANDNSNKFARVSYAFLPHQLGSNGLPDSIFSDRYYAIEDRVLQTLPALLFVGSWVSEGKREIWYCGKSNTLTHDLQRAFEAFRDCPITVTPVLFGEVKDLQPSDLESQLAQNAHVVETLEKNGDDHSVSRTIDHLVIVNESSDVEYLRTALVKLGYSIFNIDQDRLEFKRNASIDLREINQETIELNGICKEANASYDGWGCPVMTAKTN
jgi:regulator of RNase E activity RraB